MAANILDRIVEIVSVDGGGIYKKARAEQPDNGARCALTVSLVLVLASILKVSERYINTATLTRHLLALGWDRVAAVSDLQPGMICFTVDDPQDADLSPEHTYIFLRWHDRARLLAMVYDNYEPAPHPRNIGNGPRTPFLYALTPPEPKHDELTDEQQGQALTAFQWLYKLPLTQDTKRLLNKLRACREFDSLN